MMHLSCLRGTTRARGLLKEPERRASQPYFLLPKQQVSAGWLLFSSGTPSQVYE